MRTEADLAREAAAWLADQGWTDLYYEVCLDYQERGNHTIGDGRADIVATKTPSIESGYQRLAVVECKLGLSLELFAQGKRWLPFADVVWVAAPAGKRSEARDEAWALAREYYGLGVLEIGDSGIRERVKPREHHRSEDALLVSLQPEHKTHAAPGTNRGGQWSSFKRTADLVTKYVAEHPGCKIAEVVDALPSHHYRTKQSAISSITKAIKRGQIPGVKTGWKQGLQTTPVESSLLGDDSL